NLTVEYRSADGDIERFPPLARDLINAKCDLIYVIGTEHPAKVLVEAKTRIPIVLIAVTYDPVKAGLVANLRQPGGNITGMFAPLPELAAKHVELMHQILPGAKRLLLLADRLGGVGDQVPAALRAAKTLGVEVQAEVFETPPP